MLLLLVRVMIALCSDGNDHLPAGGVAKYGDRFPVIEFATWCRTMISISPNLLPTTRRASLFEGPVGDRVDTF
jgi:hypothetical protein